MSSATNSSTTWTYFKKIDTRHVSCNLFGKHYKTSGNTTNLATHLKSKHYHAYDKLKSTMTNKKKKGNGETSSKNAAAGVCNNEITKTGEAECSIVGEVNI